jgi:hypothetical protein
VGVAGVAVCVGVPVAVAVAVGIGGSVAVAVAVGVGSGVWVAVAVAVGIGVAVCDRVAVGLGVGAGVRVLMISSGGSGGSRNRPSSGDWLALPDIQKRVVASVTATTSTRASVAHKGTPRVGCLSASLDSRTAVDSLTPGRMQLVHILHEDPR